MKKAVIVIISVMVVMAAGMVFCYMAGRNLAEKAYGREITAIEQQYKEQLELYKKQFGEEGQEESKSKGGEAENPDMLEEPYGEEIKHGTVTAEPQLEAADGAYEYIGFEAVYQAYCTPEQLEAIKAVAGEAVKTSEYGTIRTITCSAYTRIETEDTRVTGYARLDDRAVLEITYSVRYGQPSAVISAYTLKELKDLEEVGVVRDDGTAETVTPAP